MPELWMVPSNHARNWSNRGPKVATKALWTMSAAVIHDVEVTLLNQTQPTS